MDHLEWLVRSRSRNQLATVALYRSISRHRNIISELIELQDLAEELAAVVFSLWRAVFLSDLVAGDEQRLQHLDLFLESLIADNTVVYATDKRSREWTFRYYITNARVRLIALTDGALSGAVDVDTLEGRAPTKKDEWSVLQDAASEAIRAFGGLLEGRTRRRGGA